MNSIELEKLRQQIKRKCEAETPKRAECRLIVFLHKLGIPVNMVLLLNADLDQLLLKVGT